MSTRISSKAWLIGLLALFNASFARGAPFNHPGLLQSRSDLEFMKQNVLAGEQPWKGAWDRLLRASYSSMDFDPKPAAHVIRGAFGRPSIGSNELMASAKAAYSQAIQWYVTRDKAHAAKAIEIIDEWAPVIQDFQLNDAKLLAGWTGHDWLNAAEILRYSDSGWQDKDTQLLRRMMMEVYYPLIKDFFPEANGNWDAAIMDTVLCIGVFFDDHTIFDRAVDHYLHGHLNGGITHYVYPSGQCQESTRDQAHTQLGLGEMAQTCQIAWTQGADLFGTADNRLALGFEYTAKYLLGEDVPCEGTISTVSRGRFSDIYQLVFQHYRFDKGIAMPYTERAAQQTLGRSLSVLTLFRGQGSEQPSAPAPKPSTIAADGGAMRKPSAPSPIDAKIVSPGESIQAAIDALQGGAGWVVLAKGVHKLPGALRMTSGLTLAGQGEDTVLWLDPKLIGPAIISEDAPLHDLNLRDLVIEGATVSHPHADPNSDRRARSRRALSRAGVLLTTSGKEQTIQRIHFEHITVRNCTLAGLQINNAADVTIGGCSFTDNGNDAGMHNVLLNHVTRCEVTESRLNNSPSGDGVKLMDCTDVTFSGDEIARSVLHGICAIGGHDIHIRHNLIEANEAGAVLLDAQESGCSNIDIRDNLRQDNGGAVIEAKRATDGVVLNNRLADNSGRNSLLISRSQRIIQQKQ